MARQLAHSALDYSGELSLERGIYPEKTAFNIGCYPGIKLLAEQTLACSLFDSKTAQKLWRRQIRHDLAADLFRLFPNAEIYGFILHSVVNLWGVIRLHQGQITRAAAGSADDGIIVNVGAPLPEEQPLLAGRSLAELNAEGDGESIVFAASSRIFGQPIDRIDISDIPMSAFKPADCGGLLRRLFRRS